MPGTVLQVRVQNGELVSAGAVLVILESMKMELAITAPIDGIVSGITLSPGDRVELGQPLVAIVSDEHESKPKLDGEPTSGETEK